MIKGNSLIHFLRSKPIFLFLFPLFFVFNGFMVHYDSVSLKETLILVLEYFAIIIVLTGIGWVIFRSLTKAALLSVIIMAFYFFFGPLHDFLKEVFPNSFIIRYRFIIPVILLSLILITIILKKRKRSLFLITAYLNFLLIILILFDGTRLLIKMPVVNKNSLFDLQKEGFTYCDSCAKQNIFLIVPDQYTGNKALNEVFHYDNSAFEKGLEQRGFYVAKQSSSNYNLTPFSVASTLNMDFLPLNEGPQSYRTVNESYKIARNSRVLKFLEGSGYRFYNLSIFDFKNQPAYKYKSFLPYGKDLITSQTFLGRFMNDFTPDILQGKFGSKLQKKFAYDYLDFNDTIFNLTQKTAAEENKTPKFVYTHLMMPHFPYYFDSKGKPVSIDKLRGLSKTNANDYIEYLQYTNQKLLQLIDALLVSSSSPPVIVILGDHGFRHPEKKIDRKYEFMNLTAVYLPNKNYELFYDSITNVNQFRVVFNTLFHQELPLLKDSTINVWD